MQYIIKTGDNLSKIAQKFSVPVTAILAVNPQITDADHIFIGQSIHIPNVEDMPPAPVFDTPTDSPALIDRARSVVKSAILYKLGSGGMFPADNIPTKDGLCDCSGFVCWVLKLSRQTTIPFYKQFGGWIFTDSMVADVNSFAGIFEKINLPEPGCMVVFGAGNKIGHVGIVSEVANGTMKKVIHCSSGNSKNLGAAIQETTPAVFNRPDTVWGRFVG